MLILRGFLCVVLVIAIDAKKSRNGPSPKQPHIIFFLVDDMGFNDVGYHGMTEIPTPNIDTLAANGIILDNYYTAPACSPSRASLLTGLYPSTNGMQHYVLQDVQPAGLPLDNKTLPEYMRDLGYKTEMIGKWHMGFHEERYLPEHRGFDHHYGFWNGDSDMFFHNTLAAYPLDELKNAPLYDTGFIGTDGIRTGEALITGLNFRRGNRKVRNRQGEYLTDVYTDETVRVLNKHSKTCPDKPLFLYLSHHGVHRGNFYMSIRAPRQYTDLFNQTIPDEARRNFAGALTAIDMSLGRVMEALEKNGMLDNTIFVFSNDNGSPSSNSSESFNGGSNLPLRGTKLTSWDGGVRGNAFIWSPFLKNSRTVYTGLMHVSDWLPTLYNVAGGNATDLKGPLDGLDMTEAIQNNLTSPRTEILYSADNVWNLTGYRWRNYKIIKGKIPGSTLDDYYSNYGRESPPPGLSTTESKTADVLRKFYKNKDVNTRPQILNIDCGNAKEVPCDIENEYCLYNMDTDPCERSNIAEGNEELVNEMLSRMEAIPKLPSLNPQYDYASNPTYYGGYWDDWIQLNVNIHADENY